MHVFKFRKGSKDDNVDECKESKQVIKESGGTLPTEDHKEIVYAHSDILSLANDAPNDPNYSQLQKQASNLRKVYFSEKVKHPADCLDRPTQLFPIYTEAQEKTKDLQEKFEDVVSKQTDLERKVTELQRKEGDLEKKYKDANDMSFALFQINFDNQTDKDAYIESKERSDELKIELSNLQKEIEETNEEISEFESEKEEVFPSLESSKDHLRDIQNEYLLAHADADRLKQCKHDYEEKQAEAQQYRQYSMRYKIDLSDFSAHFKTHGSSGSSGSIETNEEYFIAIMIGTHKVETSMKRKETSLELQWKECITFLNVEDTDEVVLEINEGQYDNFTVIAEERFSVSAIREGEETKKKGESCSVRVMKSPQEAESWYRNIVDGLHVALENNDFESFWDYVIQDEENPFINVGQLTRVLLAKKFGDIHQQREQFTDQQEEIFEEAKIAVNQAVYSLQVRLRVALHKEDFYKTFFVEYPKLEEELLKEFSEFL